MKIIDCQQGSVEWMLARSGIVTASELDALVTPLGKVKTGDGPKTYVMQKVAEHWIGGPLPAVMGVFDLEQGKILEEQARPAFTLETGLAVHQVGFIESDDRRMGCSPDGLGDGFGLELKCPHVEKHIRYLLDGVVPADYVAQVQGSLFVTGLDVWYFSSYRRRFPQLVLKVGRDEKYQKAISEALDWFRGRFDDALRQLIAINGGPPDPRHRGNLPFQPPQQQPESIDLIP